VSGSVLLSRVQCSDSAGWVTGTAYVRHVKEPVPIIPKNKWRKNQGDIQLESGHYNVMCVLNNTCANKCTGIVTTKDYHHSNVSCMIVQFIRNKTGMAKIWDLVVLEKLTGEELSRYLNKIESICLRKD